MPTACWCAAAGRGADDAAALAKVEGEDRTRDELKQGALLADVFKKYGIL